MESNIQYDALKSVVENIKCVGISDHGFIKISYNLLNMFEEKIKDNHFDTNKISK